MNDVTVVVGFLVVFALRVSSVALGTLRQIVVVRGHRFLGAIAGFFEVLIFVLAISKVIQEGNWGNILGYCAGFAVGTVVGASAEERLALGYSMVRIITQNKARELASALRDHGFGVTELVGEGRDGLVYILEVVARRKKMQELLSLTRSINDRAFVTTAEAYGVQRGYFAGTSILRK